MPRLMDFAKAITSLLLAGVLLSWIEAIRMSSAKNPCRSLAISFGLATNLATLLAFVPSPRFCRTKRASSNVFLALKKNITGTRIPTKFIQESESGLGPAEFPLGRQPLRIQGRLQEIHQRSLSGELTQEYCDTTIGLCVAAAEWESVLDISAVMKQQNLTQERATFRMCFQYCFEMGDGALTLKMLRAMDQALIETKPSDIGLVAAAMCRNNRDEAGWWRKALELLLSRPSPDVPIDAYDAVFGCLVDECDWKESIRLLRRLEQPAESDGIRNLPEPTVSTYREVIECCVAANQVEQAVQMLLSMEKRGIMPTVYTFELVISALAKKLQWRRALQLLDLMDKCGVHKSAQTYNALISACARGKEIGIAKNLVSRMKKEGILPSLTTYNSKPSSPGEVLWRSQISVSPLAVAFAALLSAYASDGSWKDAMNVLDQVHLSPHLSPDIYTYTNAIRAFAKGGKTERAFTLYEVARSKKIVLDSYFYAAVIEAAANARLWKRALGLLSEMEAEGIHPTDVIFSLTIKACGNAGQWQESLKLLEKMRSKGLRINLITYNNALAALAKASKNYARRPDASRREDPENSGNDILWIRAAELLDQMKADGIILDGFSFSSAISCFGGQGKWEEALALLNLMTKGGPRTQPNKLVYTAAIDACGRSGEYLHALQLFRNMTSAGIPADRVAYNTLFHSFRVAGKADLAYELWEEMCGAQTFTINGKGPPNAGPQATPDIITVTDLIATLSDRKKDGNLGKVDQVFANAVNRGIVLASHLDSVWEVDLSGMALPVARAACRFVMNRTRRTSEQGAALMDLNFITGVGVGQGRQNKQSDAAASSIVKHGKGKPTSLRDYIQEVLEVDFAIKSTVPKLAQGTIQIDKSELALWVARNLY